MGDTFPADILYYIDAAENVRLVQDNSDVCVPDFYCCFVYIPVHLLRSLPCSKKAYGMDEPPAEKSLFKRRTISANRSLHTLSSCSSSAKKRYEISLCSYQSSGFVLLLNKVKIKKYVTLLRQMNNRCCIICERSNRYIFFKGVIYG